MKKIGFEMRDEIVELLRNRKWRERE